MLNIVDSDARMETDLEIKLLALEISEFENYQKNMKVADTI